MSAAQCFCEAMREEARALRLQAWREDIMADDAPPHEQAMHCREAALCDLEAERCDWSASRVAPYGGESTQPVG